MNGSGRVAKEAAGWEWGAGPVCDWDSGQVSAPLSRSEYCHRSQEGLAQMIFKVISSASHFFKKNKSPFSGLCSSPHFLNLFPPLLIFLRRSTVITSYLSAASLTFWLVGSAITPGNMHLTSKPSPPAQIVYLSARFLA